MLDTISSQHNPLHSSFSAEGHDGNILVTDNVRVIQGDTVDNPLIKILVGGPSKSEENIVQKMKYECNRLYSFRNWPVKEVTPESLAAAGFFYLQHEDQVQCPFCYVTIYNWTPGDNPLSEHIKKRPKCPFLIVGSDVGNIPLNAKGRSVLTKPVTESQFPSRSTCALYKPQHPRMADVRRRLLTYSDWPSAIPTPHQLAECGLYYTGVADVVKCFFCGGSLGNWESDDDPWNEHSKFFPDCSFLSLANSRNVAAKAVKSCGIQSAKSNLVNGLHTSNPVNGLHKVNEPSKLNTFNGVRPSSNYSSDVAEALNIFPKPLVLEAVKQLGGTVHSLQELCDKILELNETPSKSESALSNISHKTSSSDKIVDKNSPTNSDALLCKICMDRQSEVLFQPCGHLVSCSKCATQIADCPVCRRPIVNVIKAYFC